MDRQFSQQSPPRRSARSQTLWLSRLIAAMEKFSRPEWRVRPVDQRDLNAARARLARPAAFIDYGTRFKLRKLKDGN